LLFGGVGGGFNVSSGEPAHAVETESSWPPPCDVHVPWVEANRESNTNASVTFASREKRLIFTITLPMRR